MEYNWALTGGAPLEAFEQWNEDMIDNGNVPEGFDWKEHADFSCLTQVQENLGLEVAARRPLRPLTPSTAGAGLPHRAVRRQSFAWVRSTGPRTQEGQLGGSGLAFTERAQDLKGPRALRRNAGGSSRRLLPVTWNRRLNGSPGGRTSVKGHAPVLTG